MPRNGSGSYSRAVTPPANGDVADADLFNSEMNDFATAITNSLARNGEATPTANLPMGGFVHTGLGAGDANGEGVRYEQVSPLFRPTETVLSPTIISGLLYGLTLANNSGDATNDIDIAAGIAIDSTNAKFLNLASGITKKLDVAWAVGTNQGGLDTGSIANTTYHVWLIMRSDTGVVDALFSTSASSPTMPTNYDYKRRIGSIIRSGGAILAFVQIEDNFYLSAAVTDRSSTSAQASTLLTLTVPSGVVVAPFVQQTQLQNTAGIVRTGFGNGGATAFPSAATTRAAGEECMATVWGLFYTNTSAQLQFAVTITSGTLTSNSTFTYGWRDTRGRLG